MTRWLVVWIRAVIGPASRRASSVWVGTLLVGGLIFGQNAMHPRDFTQLALHMPIFGGAVALTWLLLFLPTARVLVRAEGASYLRSLPGPRWQPIVVGTLAMFALQWPWLVVWIAGDGLRGFAVVALVTAVIVAVALWRPRLRRAGWPHWRGDQAALRGVYVRALRRRASDALVRGVGFAVLAGLAAGLVVRNNALAGPKAAVFGSGVIAIVLAPGWVGALFPLLEAHRSSAWLATSLGMTAQARVAVLATVVAAVYGVAALVAAGIAALAFDVHLGWLAGVTLPVAGGCSLIATRGLIWADRGDVIDPARVVIGAILATALAVLCLAWLGLAGVIGIVVIGLAAVLSARLG